MTHILVTGAQGFIGKNLIVALGRNKELCIHQFDKDNTDAELADGIAKADCVYHLAGINRPETPEEFKTGNVDLTEKILSLLKLRHDAPPIIMTSSIQAELDNPYGISKRKAEEALQKYHKETGNKICIYRLPNVFGKWCRPNYNSVVATFCYNVTHNEPLTINDPAKAINFIYIDDVVYELQKHISENFEYKIETIIPGPTYTITLGALAELLYQFRDIRTGGLLPDFANKLEKYLYSTFLSYYEKQDIQYLSDKKVDNRGYLFELIKTKNSGQIFVSRTLPGITRGNHYHDTKVEKFCVLDGKASIKLRHIITNELHEIIVDGHECKIIDIPPGWTHSITNIGTTDLLTLFWANEIFDQNNPDTYFCEV
ncbi:NAD-dependent epimerase/dehydratase family protein [Gracilinema caldarium]|uniref:NAD-dependent epimerase/dehydratase n=1 Tax=Gracilinema caldarium (strain ATCC 51460 / DSM 7334 / H1) TaxID=744872 RepID=F8F034_GRAC1|nr:NAD-dependent epimerase/dehydratase family protein [Gracilinema caldarium]AEJ18687.1 NAD-dependent epimerase/dehydratase [Gracilinema caldarium DSM 7334]